jgi:hypothetical protein
MSRIGNACPLLLGLDVLLQFVMLAHQILDHRFHVRGLPANILGAEAVQPQQAFT